MKFMNLMLERDANKRGPAPSSGAGGGLEILNGGLQSRRVSLESFQQ
jgi:hypothetical protein